MHNLCAHLYYNQLSLEKWHFVHPFCKIMKNIKGGLVKPFSQLIREKRLEKGFSMDKLCHIVQEKEGPKISKSLLNFLEKGQRVPTYEMAYGLSRILDIDIKQAISAAYMARVERDLTREKKSLEDFLANRKVKGLDPDSILALSKEVQI